MSSKKRAPRRGKRSGTTLPYVQRHGNGFRGWYSDGKRLRRGPLVSTEAQAHEWAVERRKEVERGLGRRGGQEPLTLGEGMDLVRRYFATKRRRDGTVRMFEGQCQVLARAWDLSMPLAKLDRRQVQWFVERRSEHTNPRTGEPISGSTIGKHLTALGRIFNVAIQEGYLPDGSNPVRGVDRPGFEKETPYRPTREEVERILGAMREAGAHDDADLVQLLFTTGLRRTELAHVRVEDVDFGGRELRVEHGKRGKRKLPIPAGMMPLLDRIIALGEPREDASGRREWAGEGPQRYLLPGETEQRRTAYVNRTSSGGRPSWSFRACTPTPCGTRSSRTSPGAGSCRMSSRDSRGTTSGPSPNCTRTSPFTTPKRSARWRACGSRSQARA